MIKNVLVTGGSGFLGRRLQKRFPEWEYMSSKDCNLTCQNSTRAYFNEINPDAIIHLAALVGGIRDNSLNQADYFYKNVSINLNVLQTAFEMRVPRVLTALSTCIFPDIVNRYPMSEEDMFTGPPPPTNFTYGYTKRMSHVHTKSLRAQYGLNYSSFAPSNIYGPGDNFDNPERSHFIAALARKLYSEKEMEFLGTGKPLRQPLYVDDLCAIIGILLEKHNTDIPLIVAPNENLSIEEMIKTAIKVSGKEENYTFNGELDGQYRKDGSNKKLLELIGDYKFTTFEEGFKKTYESYRESKCRQQ